ncbi:Scr1 family TA system antitoxin-like transcriptional regulator [Kitasatospora sp. GP82]|uniref:Scr1 family TA system antitoxin-like transcriptional regulator n=1 Tax=Kitasatospora sp. GP82 TaxID=3035089 RepID=UPI00247555AE|nr:Scr1 family TA system antitoxin-like transcriptional regulator [Kitasatospora sp. GP82]MDH6130340.1 hypothetical protein [Kitasatospora sp. GP82]
MSRYGSIRAWEPLIIPWLFQTEDYAAAVLERSKFLWKEDNPLSLDEAVESRERRKPTVGSLETAE